MDNYASSPMLTNVTFSGNSAGGGGGMYNYASSHPTLVNSIVWGNDAPDGPQIYNTSGSTPTITYSNIQGSSVYTGVGNINADPQFVAPITATAAPTTTGNYRLRATSPAIDAGNNYSVTASTDLDGKPRKVNVAGVPDTGLGASPLVDMGAYEVQEKRVYLPVVIRH
jgi:hypothetical protein